MKTKKLFGKKIIFSIIVIFQILLLINMSVADSYNIYKTARLIETPRAIENNDKNEIKNLIDFGINLLTGIFSIKQIGIVSAENAVFWCCPETNEGAICQDTLSTNSESCSVPLIETSCDYVTDCEKGCCFDTEEGTCQTNSPKGKCTSDGGEWFEDKDCNVAECQEGCCVLGSNTRWVTETRCEYLSSEGGFDEDFRNDITTELECLALSATQEEGACVLNERCSIQTEAECLSNEGSFEGGFCSDIYPEDYIAHNYTGCLNEQMKYDVYWFDSEGNREDIAEECGYPQGKCIDGVCKNLGCGNAIANVGTQDRLNGEKWCLYDGYVGDGKDTVGSEHWLAYCHEGEVEIIRCGDARSYICVESVGENGISTASLVPNDAAQCIGYNSNPNAMEENCKANKDCMIKNINVDTYFKFDYCVPRYPSGGEAFCGVGSQTCTAHYEKNWRGKWKCKKNCNCYTTLFTNQMNDFCISLGDCGTYVNYIGDGTINTVQPESLIQKQCDEIIDEWEDNEPKDVCYWYGGESIVGEYGMVEEIAGSGCFSSCEKLSSESACEENELCFWDEGTYTVWEGYVGRGCKSVCENLINESACGNNTLCYWIGGESTEGVCKSACGELGEALCSCEKGAIENLLDNYAIYAEPVEGQCAEPKDAREILGMILGAGGNYDPNNEEDVNKALEKIGKISGALGVAAAWSARIPGAGGIYTGWGIGGIQMEAGTYGAAIGPFANAAVGAGIGMLLGSWAAKKLEISGDAATAMVISGGVAGGAIGYAVWQGAMTGLWPIVIVAITVMVYIWLTGWGKTEGRDVPFKCLPWQAPAGGENCERCNEDPNKPCTEYRCSSLGQACHLLNDDTDNPVCESLAYETHPPVLSAGEVLTENYIFTTSDFVDKKIRIEKSNGDCIQEYTSVNFTLETDEYARCKYSFEIPASVDYDEMGENYPLEGSIATTTHTFEINIPSIHALEVSGVTGDLMELFGNMNIYIKCQDYHGNSNIAPYVVNFCVNSEPDQTAAGLKEFIPKNNSYSSYGTTEKFVELILREPAECKYDTERGKDYDDMEYSMECETDSIALYTFGYCNTTLANLTNENTFYIKCKDKPWWEDCSDEDKEKYKPRNINEIDFDYTLYVSENELEIDSIKINYKNQKITSGGVIKEGFEPISVNLEVETSGGMDNGKSTCYWGEPLTTPFWEDYGTSDYHKQPLTGRMRGDYNNSVKCEDGAGNIVQGYIEFKIEIDSDAPIIISNRTEGNDLIFETNELAECYYHLEKCNFNFENGTKITTGVDTKHTLENLDPKRTYHVKCGDVYGNKNSDCAMIIEATEENDYTPPTVVRAYYKKGELKLITNKRAKCYFGIFDCVFDLKDGKLMTDKKKDYSTEHSTDWKTGQTYYIKCEDAWENSNEEGCAIIIGTSL